MLWCMTCDEEDDEDSDSGAGELGGAKRKGVISRKRCSVMRSS
jgi:hypothetical protein